MVTVGIIMATVSALCLFIALFYINYRKSIKKSMTWMGVAYALMFIAFSIT